MAQIVALTPDANGPARSRRLAPRRWRRTSVA